MSRSPRSISRAQLPPRRRRSAGFALLITLTLLAFVVLLLVGLASYTRIETAVAGNFQKQAQARQNALLALDVALAQLQKHAGPDTRVTATAESVPSFNSQKRFYTGVWDAAAGGASPVWLVSGLETNTAQNVTEAITPAADQVVLVGPNTNGSAFLANGNPGPTQIVVRRQNLTSVGVPGQAGATAATIGRYAWWIGDQGVKAPVGLRDTTAGVDYAPFDSAELRSRIRQQIALGAGAFDTSVVPPAPVFEPRAANNTTLAANTIALNQLAFFNRTTSGTVGLTTLQQRYRDWTTNNYNVLADTAGTGLRRDLSLDPSLLGPAAQAWLDYPSYMEDPAAASTSSFPPLPPFSADPLRRRYAMQAGSPTISPVLSFFLLSFNVRTLPTAGGSPSASPQPVQVRLRGAFTLWNPYSAALVPENLILEVSGLPSSLRLDNTDSPGNSVPSLPFASLFSGPTGVRFSLSWSLATSTGSAFDSRASWLPGRAYSWTIGEDTSGNSPLATGYSSVLDSQNISTVSGNGVQRPVSGVIIDGSDSIHLETSNTTVITARLIAPRATGDVTLATFVSPSFDSFRTAPRPLGNFTYSPTFVFRLAESENGTGAWLTTPNLDARAATVPSGSYVIGTTGAVNGPNPSLYENVTKISSPDRLLDRDVASATYNEDVPVFELPRAPLLSLGALQHLALDGARPFSIGNSWGATTPLNGIPSAQLFDRFFFSGLVPAAAPTDSGANLVLPNSLLRVSPRKADGTPTTAADLRGAANATSSQFLLQGGAFNLNSVSATAWAAVLRGIRFPSPAQFDFVAADPATGTASVNGEVSATPLQSTDAQFFRFSQSAQETYQAEPNLAAGAGNTSAANTHLFRNGVITLDTAKVTALANAIAAAIRARHASSGPFRSLAEFLSPATPGGPSLLEDAIATANINVDAAGAPIEFSSQFLTQGDIMTALAPVLFPRSDTFVIRTYGEAVNPTTAASEGKAWCEAIVQRTPDYFDPTQDATVVLSDLNPANQTYGRRFKVVSFRWLTRSDL